MATDMMEQSDKLALRFKTIGNLWNVPVPLDAKGYDSAASGGALKTFVTFDGATIAYHDEGEGSPVILSHGYGVDGLGQFGNLERILPLLEKRQTLFIETLGDSANARSSGRWTPRANPPAAKARVILPDMRGFGASSNRATPAASQIGPWPAT